MVSCRTYDVVLAIIRFRRAPDLRRLECFWSARRPYWQSLVFSLRCLDPAIVQTVAARLSSITNLKDGTVQWRTSDFLLALQAWALKPIVGYGPGTWGTVAYGYVGKTAVTSPRNIITAWLFERGLVGALLAIGFYKLFIERALRAYRWYPLASVKR